MKKDGTSFQVHHSFPISTEGRSPSGSIAKASNGAIYGTTQLGGDPGAGTIFEFFPSQTPEIVGIKFLNQSPQITISGQGGNIYQLLRSPDLTNWVPIATLTMPPENFSTNFDYSVSGDAAFYRAAWLP